MDFNTEVLKYKDDFLKDLNTLVSYESVRDESTKTENAPFGKNCRDVLDAMLDMAKRDGFEAKDVDDMQVLLNMERVTKHLVF